MLTFVSRMLFWLIFIKESSFNFKSVQTLLTEYRYTRIVFYNNKVCFTNFSLLPACSPFAAGYLLATCQQSIGMAHIQFSLAQQKRLVLQPGRPILHLSLSCRSHELVTLNTVSVTNYSVEILISLKLSDIAYKVTFTIQFQTCSSQCQLIKGSFMLFVIPKRSN